MPMDSTFFELLMQHGMYTMAIIGMVITIIRFVIDLIDRNNKKK